MKNFLRIVAILLVGIFIVTNGEAQVPKQTEKIKVFDVEEGKHKEVDLVAKSEKEWKDILTPEQFKVTRQHGTERAFTGDSWDEKRNGIYKCIACGTDLFTSDTKFDSGTGWPSFWQPVDPSNVGTQIDRSFFSERVEVHCVRCGAHLGHIFDDGPPPTQKRYCINSVSLQFKEKN